METISERQKKINKYRKETGTCSSKIIQFTHGRDLDGKISGMLGEMAAICTCNEMRLELIDNSSEFNEIITDFIYNKFKGYDLIIISDLTLNEKNANLINNLIEDDIDKSFIICDHHKADYITENENYKWRKNCARSEEEQCGASLLYEALKHMYPSSYRAALKAIAEKTRIYDNFIWKRTDDLVARNMSRISYLNPDYIDELMHRVLNLKEDSSRVDLFSDEDRIMLKEEDNNISNYIHNKLANTVVSTVHIDGKLYNVAFTFAVKYQSELGSEICKNLQVDFACMLNPENNSISLRGHGKIDLSKIAKKYFNGGGHPNASGGQFNASKLLVGLDHIFS